MQILGPFVHEAAFTAIIAVLGAIAMWPFKAVKKEWEDFKKRMEDTHSELVAQRTNCFATLTNQGDKQIEVLDKCASTLEAIHLGQVEMSGYIKAQNDHRS